MQGAKPTRSKERGNVEANWQDQERARLVLLLLDIFRDHSPNDTDSTVDGTTKGPPKDSLPKGSRKSDTHTRDTGTNQTRHEHKLPASPGRIGNPTPRDSGRELRGSKSTLQDTGLGRDRGIRQIFIEGFELVEHVGLQRGDLEEIEDTAETEETQLSLARQGHPGHRRRLFWDGVHAVDGICILLKTLLGVDGVILREGEGTVTGTLPFPGDGSGRLGGVEVAVGVVGVVGVVVGVLDVVVEGSTGLSPPEVVGGRLVGGGRVGVLGIGSIY